MSARRNGKRSAQDNAVSEALAVGEHVHIAEADGVRCVSGCPTDGAGYLPRPKPSTPDEVVSWLDAQFEREMGF